MCSSDKTEPTALSFGLCADLRGDFEHFLQDANRRFAAQNINALDRYRNGDVCVVVNFRLGVCPEQQQLILSSVPQTACGRDSPADCSIESSDSDAFASSRECRPCGVFEFECELRGPDTERDQCEVFLGVTNLVQGPEGVIPSFVCIAPFKERTDFRRQVLTTPAHSVEPMCLVIREGELDMLERCTLSRDGAGVGTLIEGGAKVVDGVEQNARQIIWKPPGKSDLMQFMETISIVIDDVGPSLFNFKSADVRCQIGDVMMCTQDAALRALKEINHGQAI